jgi:lipopolysaccharide transport system ATP-binding protein
MEPAISVRNLCKNYHLYKGGRHRLKEVLFGWTGRHYYTGFKALDGVNLEVMPGECMGILGRNGSGKSTLLQCIAGTLTPTSGSIHTRGRIGALLELGAGFAPDYTGRENINLYSAILGMKARETREQLDEIIDFADIGEYIDQPVRTYSSGMYIRLAFAVNACIRPDVLIIDEALAVGDAPFQAKCFRYLRELLADGAAILFVSHNIQVVRGICCKALWLDKGRTRLEGKSIDITREYDNYCYSRQGTEGLESGAVKLDDEVFQPFPNAGGNPVLSYLFESAVSNSVRYTRSGTGNMVFLNAVLTNEKDEIASTFKYNEKVTAHFLLYTRKPDMDSNGDYYLCVIINDLMGNPILCVHSHINREKTWQPQAGDYFVVTMSFGLPLSHKDYAVNAGLIVYGDALDEAKYDYSKAEHIDTVTGILYFSVLPLGNGWMGPVFFLAESSIKQLRINSKGS